MRPTRFGCHAQKQDDDPNTGDLAGDADAASSDGGDGRDPPEQRRTLAVLVVTQVLSAAGLAAGITAGALLAQDVLGATSLAGRPSALFTIGSAAAAAVVGRSSPSAPDVDPGSPSPTSGPTGSPPRGTDDSPDHAGSDQLGNGVATACDRDAGCRTGLWEVPVSPLPRRWTPTALYARGKRAVSLWRAAAAVVLVPDQESAAVDDR
jgi:hypothetical protein